MYNRFENFTILISKINRSIRKIKNYEMAEYNLRSSHISILFYLCINKSLTASDLCEKCEEDKATISRSLDFLEKKNFVICNSKLQKRYNSPFELTDKGLEASKKILDKVDQVLDKVKGCLSEEERIKFYINLTEISEALEKICEQFD